MIKTKFLSLVIFISFLAGVSNLNATEETTRKTYLVRGQDFWVNVYTQGDKEIARTKESRDGILEQTGTIPDGKVNFYDGFHNALGEENYKNGVRHGEFKEYYPEGQLKVEAYYERGKLLTRKEYTIDGKLRMEEDYTDAVEGEKHQKEVGEGKIYYENGNVKYEWNFTNSSQGGFQKAYTESGELRFEAYFDRDGNLVAGSNVTMQKY